MGDAQSVPGIGEVVTVTESTTKLLAAGYCKLVGNDKAAKRLAEGASKSWEEYSEKNIIAASINSTRHMINGNNVEAERIARKCRKSLEGFVDSVPVVGHTKGLVHYAAGDIEYGKQCMIGASRATIVAGAGALTGGLGGGFLMGGLAGSKAGIVFDAAHTKIDSYVHGENRYHGLYKTIDQYAKTGDPNKIIDGSLDIVGDFTVGAASAYAAKKATRKKHQQHDKTTTYELTADTASESMKLNSKVFDYESANEGGSESRNFVNKNEKPRDERQPASEPMNVNNDKQTRDEKQNASESMNPRKPTRKTHQRNYITTVFELTEETASDLTKLYSNAFESANETASESMNFADTNEQHRDESQAESESMNPNNDKQKHDDRQPATEPMNPNKDKQKHDERLPSFETINPNKDKQKHDERQPAIEHMNPNKQTSHDKQPASEQMNLNNDKQNRDIGQPAVEHMNPNKQTSDERQPELQPINQNNDKQKHDERQPALKPMNPNNDKKTGEERQPPSELISPNNGSQKFLRETTGIRTNEPE